MPDLGAYAFYVLSAYAVSLTLIIALCLLTLHRARRVRDQLSQVEARAQKQG